LEQAGWITVDRSNGARSSYTLAPIGTGDKKCTGDKKDTATSDKKCAGSRVTGDKKCTGTSALFVTHSRKEERGKKKGANEAPIDAALPFDSEPFRKAWSDFSQHRAQSKHPLTELAASRILAKCQRWGEAKAIEALDLAIENDWRGIFPPKSNGKPNGSPTPRKAPYVFSAAE
jgi:hypothetical protein